MKIKKALIITGLISTFALSSCSISMKDNPTDTTETTVPTTTNITTDTGTDPITSTGDVNPSTGSTPIEPTTTQTSPTTTTTPTNPTTTTGTTPTTNTGVTTPTTNTGITTPTTNTGVTTPTSTVTPTQPTSTPTTTTTTSTPVVNKYNVTLYVDGTQYDKYQVEEGTVLTLVELTKEGYTFYGWYTDSSCQTPYNNTNVTKDVILYSRFVINNVDNDLTLTSYNGYREGAFIELDLLDNTTKSDYTITYKKSSDSEYKSIDSELIRVSNNHLRADILGLSASQYDIKVVCGSKYTNKMVTVGSDDRSGYAHFNYSSGIGAYNNDGTLKTNAIVIYVTNATKNTVSYGGKTGLVNILNNNSIQFNYIYFRCTN